MKKKRARRMLATARDFVGGDLFEPWRFKDVDLGVFLENYLWVIFVSGFRNAVVEKHFETLKEAFHGLDLDKIVTMGSIDADNLPIANQRKADAFIEGCRLIKEEGWKPFKKRLRKHGRAALLEAPVDGARDESALGACARRRGHGEGRHLDQAVRPRV